jgi:hypothetical protein
MRDVDEECMPPGMLGKRDLIAGLLVLSLHKRPWLASRYPISPAERRPDGRTLGGMMKSALRARRAR